MLKVENLYGGYQKGHNVLHGINLEIAKGEVLAIVGHNGSGKSTLAKAIMGLLPFNTGTILFDNKNITDCKTHELINLGIGYFSQGGRIFPHLSVKENIKFAGRNFDNKTFTGRLNEIIDNFTVLQNFSERQWNNNASYLSGGERHQLALAMNLIMKPSLLVLDEPSAGLAPTTVSELYLLLNDLKRNERITYLLIEQNVQLAVDNSNRVVFLKNGDIDKNLTGKIENSLP